MAELTLRFNLSFGARTLRCLMAAGMVFSVATEVASESVTLTTYYPAPSGVYAQMITTGNTYLARDGGNVGIGTAAPGYKLDDTGNFHAAGAAQLDSSLNVNAGATIGTTLTVNGAGIYNRFGSQLVETSANDWTRWNQSQGATNGNAMYQSLSLGTGGLTVGTWINQPSGNIYATGHQFDGGTYVNGAGGTCGWTSFNVGSATVLCGVGQYVTMQSGVMTKYTAIVDGTDPAGEAFCCPCPPPGSIVGIGYANGCPSL